MTSVIVDSERFYTNPFPPGVEQEVDVFGTGPDGFLTKLKGAWITWVDKLSKNVLKDGLGDDPSIYTGSTGILWTYRIFQDKHPEVIHEAIREVLKKFPQEVLHGHILKKKRFTLLCGDAGPITLALMLTSVDKERDALVKRLLDLQDLVYAENTRDGSPTPNEHLYGRVGYLFALLFLNQHFDQNRNPLLIQTDVIAKLAAIIIEDGDRNKRKEGPHLHYEWHDKVYLGAAHGYVGILYILLKAREYLSSKNLDKVKNTLDWVLSQQYPSGNLRSSVGSKDDKLVHWCHGAVGAIFLFLEAAKAFPEERDRYLKAALACGDVVWTRGILKRSYSLCHGVAGNAYALLALFKFTTDGMWLRRSCLFAQWCFSWGKRSTRDPDRPNSLFEGLAGNVYMLYDFYRFLSAHVRNNGSTQEFPEFPCFELH